MAFERDRTRRWMHVSVDGIQNILRSCQLDHLQNLGEGNVDGAKNELLIKYEEVMSKKRNGVNWSKSPNARARRYRALKGLEATLKSPSPHHTDKDIKRMEKEVAILKERL